MRRSILFFPLLVFIVMPLASCSPIGPAAIGVIAAALAGTKSDKEPRPVVLPARVTSPKPTDTGADVPVTTNLGWETAERAELYDVYLGADNAEVQNAGTLSPSYLGRYPTNFIDPTPGTNLDYNSTYYWRVDSINAHGTTKGALWDFAAEAEPTAPPAEATDTGVPDGTIDVPVDGPLTWEPVPGAYSYDIYFGTDPNAVANADNTSPEFRGNQADLSFNLPMDYSTTYYWRIDTVNALGTTTSSVWFFVTLTPPAPVAGFIASPTSGASPLLVTFTDESTGVIDSWEWDFDNDTVIDATTQDASHVYTDYGAYTVKLTVTGPGGSDDETKTDCIAVCEPPAADFTADTTGGTAPLAIQFTDISSGDITSWSWDFGDGNSSAEQDPSHAYAVIGTYTVKLTVTGPAGSDEKTNTDYITAYATLTVMSDYGNPSPLVGAHQYAPGSSITVGAEALADDGQPTRYVCLGYMGTGDLTSGGSTNSVTFTITQDTYVIWQWAAQHKLTVDANPADSGTVSPATRYFDENATVSLRATSNAGWTFSNWTGDMTGTTNPINIVMAAPRDITANFAGSVPLADFTATPTIGAAPLDVTFADASAGDVTSWLWGFGDGGTSTAQNPGHIYASDGAYTVTLTATGTGGFDQEIKTNYITVGEPPPVADFTATPTSGDVPLVVSFTDASTGAVTSWSWNFGDGGTSTAQSPSHTYTSDGAYTVTLTVISTGGSDQEVKTNCIALGELPPVADFTATPTTGDVPLTVTFTDASTGTITSWEWDFGTQGWQYRKAITISNPGSQLTDYQVKVIVSFVAGKMQGNFNDLRFTAGDGKTLLNYWIEEFTVTSFATVWVKVPSIPGGDSTIYLYYGNPDASSTSTTNRTFIRTINNLLAAWTFDEGTGSSSTDMSGCGRNATLMNSPAWSTTDKKFGNAAINLSAVFAYVQVPGVRLNPTWALECWAKFPLPATSSGWRTLFQTGPDESHVLVHSDGSLGQYNATSGTGFYSCGFDVDTLAPGWHHIVAVGSGSSTEYYVDGSYVGTANTKLMSDIYYLGNHVMGGQNIGLIDEGRIYSAALTPEEIADLAANYGYATPGHYCKIFVRKRASPEPTASVTVAEEQVFDPTDPNPSYIYWIPGTYTVSLTVTGPYGSHTETKTDYVTATSPDTIYVDGTSGNDTNDGSTWAAAVKTIRRGLDLAGSSGWTILVADGTYTDLMNTFLDFAGKAIYLKSTGGAANCIIDCESIGYGFWFHSGEAGDSVVEGFTIKNGNASDGGAILCENASSPTISNCIITNNSADYSGGGICCREECNPTILNCTITNNFAASLGGGGISCGFFSKPTIKNCSITNNTAEPEGGGIFCGSDSSPTITNCIIEGNMAVGTYSSGGGISCLPCFSNPVITNCVITNNSAISGGGLFCLDSNATITNCTITSNYASESGGGIRCGGPMLAPVISNSIFWGNFAILDGSEIYLEGFVTLRLYCCDYANGAGDVFVFDGTIMPINCINLDPQFVNAAGGDYHLQAGSPCINAGSNLFVPLGITTDLDGNARIVNGMVDIGAYEKQ